MNLWLAWSLYTQHHRVCWHCCTGFDQEQIGKFRGRTLGCIMLVCQAYMDEVSCSNVGPTDELSPGPSHQGLIPGEGCPREGLYIHILHSHIL